MGEGLASSALATLLWRCSPSRRRERATALSPALAAALMPAAVHSVLTTRLLPGACVACVAC